MKKLNIGQNLTETNNLEVFRPRYTSVTTGGAWILIFGMVMVNFPASTFHGKITSIIWAIFFGFGIYLLIRYPKVLIFDEGISIINPLNQVTVGWGKVQSIEARYTMHIIVAGKNIYAWAAPAPGRYHARKIHPNDIKGMNIGAGGIMRPGESPRSESGVATHLARLRLEKFQSSEIKKGCVEDFRWNFFGIFVLGCSFLIGMVLHFFN